ncbi:MAG TPA: hypothetical protein VFK94_02085, partial [Patescibacteria group bacterium]|nr:hypothetical protein [Patescibacteria group bacterium]
RTPLNWSQCGERQIFGSDLVEDAEEKVRLITANLKAAQNRQQKYYNQSKVPREFDVGDYAYLKVSPSRGVQRFGVRGKLAPRYIGPYEIIEKFSSVAYRLKLPETLSAVHDTFHISQLRKGVRKPESEIINNPDDVELESDLSYEEYPETVLDTKERATRRKTVKMYKIQWKHHTEEEATWETEEYLNNRFPGFLPSQASKS